MRGKSERPATALRAVRVFLGLTMIIHGVARIWAGGVAPFGEFLAAQQFPFGAFLAWAITLYEIGGGALLASGRLVAPLAALFAAELLAGIVLVHAAHGWFVVGLGRNGMEYSALLIVNFLAVAWAHWPRAEDDEPTRSKPEDLRRPSAL